MALLSRRVLLQCYCLRLSSMAVAVCLQYVVLVGCGQCRSVQLMCVTNGSFLPPQMTADSLVYTFALNYQPRAIGATPIIRTSSALVGIQCHYLRLEGILLCLAAWPTGLDYGFKASYFRPELWFPELIHTSLICFSPIFFLQTSMQAA